MKNKHKRQFNNTFHWWDYHYLLEAMHTWLVAAEKGHRAKGTSINAEKKADRIKVARLMCERALEGRSMTDRIFSPEVDCDYSWIDVGGGYIQLKSDNFRSKRAGGDWESCSQEMYEKYVRLNHQKDELHHKAIVDAFFDYMKKYIHGFWD